MIGHIEMAAAVGIPVMCYRRAVVAVAIDAFKGVQTCVVGILGMTGRAVGILPTVVGAVQDGRGIGIAAAACSLGIASDGDGHQRHDA
jgi:hypothetical protein